MSRCELKLPPLLVEFKLVGQRDPRRAGHAFVTNGMTEFLSRRPQCPPLALAYVLTESAQQSNGNRQSNSSNQNWSNLRLPPPSVAKFPLKQRTPKNLCQSNRKSRSRMARLGNKPLCRKLFSQTLPQSRRKIFLAFSIS